MTRAAVTPEKRDGDTLTSEQQGERQCSIALHMTLLAHSSTCHSTTCSANCNKMKGLIKHAKECKIKAKGGCNVCKRIWALYQIHARHCNAIPNCMRIRDHYEQLEEL